MSTTTSSTKSTVFESLLYPKPELEDVVSGEQESYRLREAQNLLHELQLLLNEADHPGMEILSSALFRAEEITLQTANNPHIHMDPEIRKTLEDINALLVSARTLNRNKQIADRFVKISDETEMALQAVRGPAVTSATREATEYLMEFMTHWRPLFYLLMSSRDFRKLLLDANKIAMHIIYSYTDDIRAEAEKKFVEGAPAQEIAETVKENVEEKKEKRERIGKKDKIEHRKSRDTREDMKEHRKSRDTLEYKKEHRKSRNTREDKKEHRKSRDTTDDKKEHRKSRDTLEDKKEHRKSRDIREDKKEHRKSRETREDKKEHRKSRDIREAKKEEHTKDHKDKDLKDTKDHKLEEHKIEEHKEIKEPKEHKVIKETTETRVVKEPDDLKDTKEHKKQHKEHKATKEHKKEEHKDLKVTKEHNDNEHIILKVHIHENEEHMENKHTNEHGVPELSDEEWDRLQDDVQRVLVILAREPTYREGIERLFTLLDLFQKNIYNEPLPTSAPENVHLHRIASETEELVASFSGREILDRFNIHLHNLIVEIQQNVNLQNYLHELKVFILKTKTEEEIRSEEFKVKSKRLASHGRELMRDLSHQEDLKPFFESFNGMMNNIKNDEFLQILRQHAGIVQSDLSYVDSQGHLQVDTVMLDKLQSALLPILADALKYIPVPKIYSCDQDREFWLDNLVLCSYDIMPEHIRFNIQSSSDISVREVEVKSHTYLVIELDKLLTELKNIEFYYRKKSFPGFEDQGRVTFRIIGEGAKLTFTYSLKQDPQDTVPRITGGYASFDISDMSIEFDKSTLTHPTMVPLLTQIFKTQIQQQIEKEVEQNLMGFIQKLGDLMSMSLTEINKPFFFGLEAAKHVVKSSALAQVYEKRRTILE